MIHCKLYNFICQLYLNKAGGKHWIPVIFKSQVTTKYFLYKYDPWSIWSILILPNYLLLIWNSRLTVHAIFYLAIQERLGCLLLLLLQPGWGFNDDNVPLTTAFVQPPFYGSSVHWAPEGWVPTLWASHYLLSWRASSSLVGNSPWGNSPFVKFSSIKSFEISYLSTSYLIQGSPLYRSLPGPYNVRTRHRKLGASHILHSSRSSEWVQWSATGTSISTVKVGIRVWHRWKWCTEGIVRLDLRLGSRNTGVSVFPCTYAHTHAYIYILIQYIF